VCGGWAAGQPGSALIVVLHDATRRLLGVLLLMAECSCPGASGEQAPITRVPDLPDADFKPYDVPEDYQVSSSKMLGARACRSALCTRQPQVARCHTLPASKPSLPVPPQVPLYEYHDAAEFLEKKQ
jgi:hypothetical protein